jgi:hypothetical protein
VTRTNIFRAHREHTLARQAAEAMSGGPLPPDVAKGPRADGMGGIIRPDAATNEAALMLVKLTSDRARLREIQSIERKIEVKRDLLPEYQAWLDGLIAGADAMQPETRNDVLTTCMMWHIDTGDFSRALELAAVVFLAKIPMPSQFDRTAGCAVAEQIADAAMNAISAKADFDVDLISETMLITEAEDMPDEVRAKLFKAQAMLLERNASILEQAGGDGADGPAAAFSATLASAKDAAVRALALNEKSGVKALIGKIERTEKKIKAARVAASQA